MQLANLLRLDYWLDFAAAQRPAGLWVVWLAGVASIAGAALVFATRRGWLPLGLGVPWSAAAWLAAGVAFARWFGVPVLGARLGWLAAAGLVAVPALARWAHAAARAKLFADAWRALAFAPSGDALPTRPWSVMLGWLGLHALGLAFVLANARLPLGLAPLLLGVLILPWGWCALRARMRQTRCASRPVASLVWLTWAYGVTVLAGLGVHIEGVFNGVLSPLLALIIAVAAAWVSGWWLAAQQAWGRAADERFALWGVAALMSGVLAWSLWTAAVLRTHGVSGSDPYAYVQMGVDWISRGSLLHRFPLAEIAYALSVPVHPVVHVGYRLPDVHTLESPSVWAPGFALFTGVAFALGGEQGLYWLNPLLNVVSVLTVFWAVWRLTNGTRGRKASLAALTAFLVVTSYQQVEWQMVPMADIAAQWLTVLGLGLALMAERSAGRALLSGLLLGAAFGVRYTQVLAAPAFALALMLPAQGGFRLARERVRLVLLCAMGAWLAAAPTLAYHTAVFGHPFVTGSEEWQHFSLARFPETLTRMLGALGHYREFGLLAPLALVGVFEAWRAERRLLLVVSVLIVVLLGFHALYTYVRLRDVLFLFPFFAWLVALGAVTSVAWLLTHRHVLLRAAIPGLLWALSMVFVLRSMETLALPVTRGFAGFGHLNAVQRAALEALRQHTPPSAVIGSTLNTGAVELHAQRLAFRPAEWAPADLLRFIEALHERKRPVFVLEDGEAQRAALQVLRTRYALRRVAELDLPYYDAIGGGSRARRVALYAVE